MKLFLYKAAIFFIGLFILGLLAESFIEKRLMQSKSRMLIGWNEIFSQELDYDLVINGNSRAWVHYNPMIFDSVLNINSYNLGIDGSSINRQVLKYNTYCKLNKNPKYIIQNIDLFTLQKTIGYEREQFFPYFFDKEIKKHITREENLNLMEALIPLIKYLGYRHLIFEAIGINREEELLIKGYKGQEKKWDSSAFKTIDKFEYAQNSSAIALFDEYIKSVHGDSIKIVFVYAPLCIEATNKINNVEGMYMMYDSIARKYNIPILDYTYIPISYDTAYFYNATHLNKLGAELFSTQLALDIKELEIFK